jgi:hypothetical protein
MTEHESVDERPNGNVTPWISVDLDIAQFPVHISFLKLDRQHTEEHWLSPQDARNLAVALLDIAARATRNEHRVGSK